MAEITVEIAAKWCGRQALWWYLSLSAEVRHDWMKFNCCWTLWISLKAARQASGISVIDLAAKSRVSVATLKRLERWFSDVEHITVGTLDRIARACDCAYSISFIGWPEAIDAYEKVPNPKPFTLDELRALSDLR